VPRNYVKASGIIRTAVPKEVNQPKSYAKEADDLFLQQVKFGRGNQELLRSTGEQHARDRKRKNVRAENYRHTFINTVPKKRGTRR